ncbi:MAG TPA: NAD(P)-dependent oxidoreductase [Chthoniobacteraceae bacterium]|nr:NAD(P)-dependent oxidoreductase [Chthoniobacteraceae bacterium]
MKILITGSLGHIASRLVPLFNGRYELKLTDLREGNVAGHPVEPLDITDYQAVVSATRGVDAVLHLAIAQARSFVTDSPRFDAGEGEEYLAFNQASIETNIRGTYHLFEAARGNRVARVVYGSSLTVLIGAPAYPAIHDGLPPRPGNFYGVTKLWGEQLGEFFSRKYGLSVLCLRFGTPHPWRENPQFPKWLAKPARRRTLVTYDDLALSVQAAMETPGPLFGVYTIVSDCPGCEFDFSSAAEIGWQPSQFIEEDGSVRPAPMATA